MKSQKLSDLLFKIYEKLLNKNVVAKYEFFEFFIFFKYEFFAKLLRVTKISRNKVNISSHYV